VVGLVAAGKSTLATALAEELARDHVDSDDQVRAITGMAGAAIAVRDGVEELHRLEAAVLLGALSLERPLVVSAAASTVESARCRAGLRRRAVVVWLDVTVDVALARTEDGDHRRPIARDELARLRARRRNSFEDLADVRVDAALPTGAQLERVVTVLPSG
jgi:shikimate kinase